MGRCAVTLFLYSNTQRFEGLLCHLGLLDPAIEGNMKLRIVGSHLPNDTAQLPRTPQSLAIPMSEPQISHCPDRFWGP